LAHRLHSYTTHERLPWLEPVASIEVWRATRDGRPCLLVKPAPHMTRETYDGAFPGFAENYASWCLDVIADIHDARRLEAPYLECIAAGDADEPYAELAAIEASSVDQLCDGGSPLDPGWIDRRPRRMAGDVRRACGARCAAAHHRAGRAGRSGPADAALRPGP
jgi:hypothetical protein